MGLISPWFDYFLTPGDPNINVMSWIGGFYPKQTLNFNPWTKFSQKSTELTWNNFLEDSKISQPNKP